MPDGDSYPAGADVTRSPKGEGRCPCWQKSSTPSSVSTPTATPTTWKWRPPPAHRSPPARSATTPAATRNYWPGSTTTPPDPGSSYPSKARAATAAGLLVLECEQPNRKARRGKGKSDPIDAHLAVLTALRLDTTRLPIPRADGDRVALRILLG